jgi:hypothetical protein
MQINGTTLLHGSDDVLFGSTTKGKSIAREVYVRNERGVHSLTMRYLSRIDWKQTKHCREKKHHWALDTLVATAHCD